MSLTFSDYGIKVNKSSGSIRTTCPVCSPGRKKQGDRCLSVNIDDGVWLCHHCGYSGGLKKQTPDWYKPVAYTKPAPVKVDMPEKAASWFEKRGISRKTLARNKIGFENGSIVFQYFDHGELVNQKFRTAKKEFRQVKGARKILYGMDDIRDHTEIVIVEGEIDKLSLEEAGIINCVSVPDGAPAVTAKNYSSKFDYLELIDWDAIKRVVLAVDADPPGRKLEDELIRRIGAEKCATVRWPDDCKDANDVLVKHGITELGCCVAEAKEIPVDGVVEISNLFSAIDGLYTDGLPGGESCGWECLDEYYTIRPGEWTVVTGIPSHGKSEWVDAVMVNLARRLGWRFAIFSPENQPLQRHCAKLMQKYIAKPFGSGPIARMTEEERDDAKLWLDDHFTMILPSDDNINLDEILRLARIVVLRKGIKGMVIDPWNEMDHVRRPGLNEAEYISECLSKIRRFARKHKVHVWVIAHPTKLRKDDKGNYPIPTPYDISGAAHWRNKADAAICVWRDVEDERKAVEVHVQKVRFREVGKAGYVELAYNIPTGIYSERSIPYDEF